MKTDENYTERPFLVVTDYLDAETEEYVATDTNIVMAEDFHSAMMQDLVTQFRANLQGVKLDNQLEQACIDGRLQSETSAVYELTTGKNELLKLEDEGYTLDKSSLEKFSD